MNEELFSKIFLLILAFWGIGFCVLSFVKAFVRSAK